MDPPPQAHTGVGHDPEYSTLPHSGQLTVTMWTEGDRAHGQRAPEPASAPSFSFSSFVCTAPPSVASAAA